MRLRGALEELLTLIMHEDAGYVEGGPQKLDEAAWRIAKGLPNPPENICIYLTTKEES